MEDKQKELLNRLNVSFDNVREEKIKEELCFNNIVFIQSFFIKIRPFFVYMIRFRIININFFQKKSRNISEKGCFFLKESYCTFARHTNFNRKCDHEEPSDASYDR